MNVFAKFDEIPSKTFQDIKETKRHGHTFVRSFVRTDGQRDNSIPSHKHSLRGGIKTIGRVIGVKLRLLVKLRHTYLRHNPYLSLRWP